MGGRHRYTPETCAQCGAEFMARAEKQRARFCSVQCCGKHAAATGKFAGPNNPRWLGGVSSDHMRYKLRTEARYPERAAARRAVQSALRSGELVRQPCERCGTEPAHGHHDDYSQPLDVRWLCRRCHDEHHTTH